MIRSRAEDSRAIYVLVLRVFLTIALAMAVVVPHSFQIVELAFFILTTLLATLYIKNDEWFNKIFATYLLGVVVTSFYIWLGHVNLAPREASNQTLLVYILSPFMWIVMSTALFQTMGKPGVIKLLISLTWFSALSVGLFIFAYLNFGKAAVSFLTEDANVNIQGGFAAATMLVYGSLIFTTGAVFAEPSMIKNKIGRIVMPSILVICALTSGRSALILSVPVGIAVGMFLRGRLRADGPSVRRRRSPLFIVFILTLVMVVVALVLDALLETLDLELVLGEFFNELSSGGGDVRTEQIVALLNGFLNNYGLGSGHGIGVSYIRNAVFPWRYEVIPAATLLRVGLVGTIIYALPFLLYGQAFLVRLARKDLTQEDIYLFGGFAAAGLAVFTNPYIESFVFQWMYLLPILGLSVQAANAKARD